MKCAHTIKLTHEGITEKLYFSAPADRCVHLPHRDLQRILCLIDALCEPLRLGIQQRGRALEVMLELRGLGSGASTNVDELARVLGGQADATLTGPNVLGGYEGRGYHVHRHVVLRTGREAQHRQLLMHGGEAQ